MQAYNWTLPDPEYQPEFYADIPSKRLIAWGVDVVIVLLITLLVLPFTAFVGLFFLPVLVFCIDFTYRVVTLTRGSATWGMRFMAIELRKSDGQTFDLPMSFLHTAGYALSYAMFLPQIISIVLMLTTSRAQGLSDHFLGTVAINRRAGS